MKVKIDGCQRFNCLSLGIDIGINKWRRKKPYNAFIEIHILFWSFGIELEQEK